MIEKTLKTVPVKLIHYSELPSTNTKAKKLAKAGESKWTVVSADSQSKGRGRFNRKWESGSKLGLWFSVILFPNLAVRLFNQINLCTAVIINEFLIREIHHRLKRQSIEIKLKWPNDIYINRKKVCGILVESSSNKQGQRFLVVGIGLNVNHLAGDFSKEIADQSISLRMVTDKIWDCSKLLENFLEYYYLNLHKAMETNFIGLQNRYQELMLFLNQKIKVSLNSQPIEGIIRGISDEGLLRLDLGYREQLIVSCDI